MRHSFVALLLVSCVPVTAAAQSTERFTLRGQVVDGVTGQPLPGMEVAIKRHPDWRLAAEPLFSGPDGRFAFYGLEAGPYTADTWLGGEIIHYREEPDGKVGVTNVGPGFKNPEFTFRVKPHPSIEGIVRDEFGDPLPHANVTAFHNLWIDGRVVSTRQAEAVTDDRGHYRISALPPGAYLVCAEFIDRGNERFRTITPEATSTLDLGAPNILRFYRRSCYPGEPPASFRIDWGQDARVDLKLGSTPGTKIQGRVANWDASRTTLNLIAEDETVALTGTSIQSDGAFDINVLEPGRYLLRAETINGVTRSSNTLVAQQTVVVDNTAVTGLQLTMQPVGTISVSMQAPEAAALQPDSVSIGLRAVGSSQSAPYWLGHGPYWTVGGADGHLSFPAIDPGTYWVLTRTSGPFCVESAIFGGRNVLHGTLTLSSGDSERLDVVLSSQCARIDGKVNIPERGAGFPVVKLMMSGTPQSPGDVFDVGLAEDGSFSVERLPAGRYYLWGWSQDDVGFPGPASPAEVANQASVVELAKGQQGVTQVKLLVGGGVK